MKKLTSLKFLFLFTSFSLFLSCDNIEKDKSTVDDIEEEDSSILTENFDSNTRGWIQEDTDYHTLDIKHGYYFIQNKDSTFGRTSTRSLDKSFLYNLPDQYSIESSIEIIESDLDTAFCGLILESASFEYEFRFFDTGEVTVDQYDYVKKERSIYNNIQSIKTEGKIQKFDIEIKIDGWDFKLYVNGDKLGDGNLSAKSWEKLAPYAGQFTSVEIDYLYIN